MLCNTRVRFILVFALFSGTRTIIFFLNLDST